MAHAPTHLGQDARYERFLHAPVGEDRRGASVTVLSMLARLGLDPWSEASDLAALPEGGARTRLESLMARFNDVQTLVADRGRIVAQLLDRLPAKTRQPKQASATSAETSATSASLLHRVPRHWIIAAVLFLGWIVFLAQGQ